MITVFGSINLDLIGNVMRLPLPGETVTGHGFATAPGGKGANQALAARRAGASVAMLGAVGEDDLAAQSLDLLDEAGVDLGQVRRVPGPTGVALILVEDSGENVIAVIPGANGAVGAEDAAQVAAVEGDALLLQLEVPVAAIAVAARKARTAGAHVILNFAPFRADALGLLPNITHLVVNESECALVAAALGVERGGPAAQADVLAAKLGLIVIVTLGPEGVLARGNGETLAVPALPVRAIDTVGAGDTFCGYLAAALGEGKTLRDALALAAKAGSLACTKAGAQPAIPLRAEVDAG